MLPSSLNDDPFHIGYGNHPCPYKNVIVSNSNLIKFWENFNYLAARLTIAHVIAPPYPLALIKSILIFKESSSSYPIHWRSIFSTFNN